MQSTGTRWRRYRLASKQSESSCITSFYFQSSDGTALTPFKPGQFLTFQFHDDIHNTDIVRNYSLSNGPDETTHYRISVKREPPPPGQESLPPGFGSSYLHDRLNTGDEIEIFGPSGGFCLDEESTRPVLLLSGGVGLTPLVSMAHRLVRCGIRRTWFIHACENGDVHAFRRELQAAMATTEKFRCSFFYNKPTDQDRKLSTFDGEGFITAERLQELLPLDDYDCYLCGPSAFMQAIYDTLTRLGIREERIHYEFFGPATVLKSHRNSSTRTSSSLRELSDLPVEKPSTSPLVTFARSGVSAPWDDKFSSILEFAEALGLAPDFSCRAGICSSCQCALQSGSVSYTEELLSELEAGTVLICCSKPAGDVVLDI